MMTSHVTCLVLALVGAVMSSPLEQQQQPQPQLRQQQQPQLQQQQQPPYASPTLIQSDYRDEEVSEPDYIDEQDGQYREELYNNINTIPGSPGVDYPIFATIPRSEFSCSDKLPGFYADEEARCQVWHYCKTDGLKESFLCPNGTIYNQANRVCEWWFNVLCEDTPASFRVNEDLYIIPSSTPEPEQQEIYNSRDSTSGQQQQEIYNSRDSTSGLQQQEVYNSRDSTSGLQQQEVYNSRGTTAAEGQHKQGIYKSYPERDGTQDYYEE